MSLAAELAAGFIRIRGAIEDVSVAIQCFQQEIGNFGLLRVVLYEEDLQAIPLVALSARIAGAGREAGHLDIRWHQDCRASGTRLPAAGSTIGLKGTIRQNSSPDMSSGRAAFRRSRPRSGPISNELRASKILVGPDLTDEDGKQGAQPPRLPGAESRELNPGI
jgi:hypothetical protein